MNGINTIKIISFWTGLLIFLFLEFLIPYRTHSFSKIKRWNTNISLSIFNGLIYNLIYLDIISNCLKKNDFKAALSTELLPVPDQVNVIAGIIIMDFSIYIWHRLNHKIPILWKFHQVHHSDMNMDASTSTRFHICEFLLSGIVRIFLITIFKIDFFTYFAFEILANLSIQFHHSSVKVYGVLDRTWILLFVPPSMHRIHHSISKKEYNSNYGAIFSLWDRLLGTFIKDTKQDRIVIGLDYCRDFQRLGFVSLLVMPFKKR